MSMSEYTLLLDESFLWFECWQAAQSVAGGAAERRGCTLCTTHMPGGK